MLDLESNHNLIFYAEINDSASAGICRGDTGGILAQWWHPVVSNIALDILH
jgi:hypothetical protein